VIVAIKRIIRKPARFAEVEWLDPPAVGDEVIALPPKRETIVSEKQKADIVELLRAGGLLAVRKI
jgi:hypothetical protein